MVYRLIPMSFCRVRNTVPTFKGRGMMLAMMRPMMADLTQAGRWQSSDVCENLLDIAWVIKKKNCSHSSRVCGSIMSSRYYLCAWVSCRFSSSIPLSRKVGGVATLNYLGGNEWGNVWWTEVQSVVNNPALFTLFLIHLKPDQDTRGYWRWMNEWISVVLTVIHTGRNSFKFLTNVQWMNVQIEKSNTYV